MHLEDYFEFLAADDIRIKGSRIGIESILYEYIYREQSPEAIHSRFPSLSLEQIYATVLYYLQRPAEVEAYIADWLQWGEQVRKEQNFNPPSIVVKLKARRAEKQQAVSTS